LRKKSIINWTCRLLVSASLICAPALHASDTIYVGASFLRIDASAEASDLNHQLESRGISAEASADAYRNGYKFFAGYRFNRYLQTELSYVGLGDSSTTISGFAADIDDFLADVEDLRPATAKGWSITMAGRYRPNNNPEMAFYGRAGLFLWQSDYRLSGANTQKHITASGQDLTYAFGVELWLSGRFTTRIELENYGVDGEDIRLLSAGVVYYPQW